MTSRWSASAGTEPPRVGRDLSPPRRGRARGFRAPTRRDSCSPRGRLPSDRRSGRLRATAFGGLLVQGRGHVPDGVPMYEAMGRASSILLSLAGNTQLSLDDDGTRRSFRTVRDLLEQARSNREHGLVTLYSDPPEQPWSSVLRPRPPTGPRRVAVIGPGSYPLPGPHGVTGVAAQLIGASSPFSAFSSPQEWLGVPRPGRAKA